MPYIPKFIGSMSPWVTSDIASVTLSTTDKAIYPAASFPPLGANYFCEVGAQLYIQWFGRYTTQLTPGNLTFDVYWGNGTDANGTIIQSSAASALTASQTNISIRGDLLVRCTAIGASGTLFATGEVRANQALIANTVQPIMIPASAPATSSAVDLTAANIISIQAKYSGSATQSIQLHQLNVWPLN